MRRWGDDLWVLFSWWHLVPASCTYWLVFKESGAQGGVTLRRLGRRNLVFWCQLWSDLWTTLGAHVHALHLGFPLDSISRSWRGGGEMKLKLEVFFLETQAAQS